MKFGFVFPDSDPTAAIQAAVDAEAAGWDAFFVWEAPWGMDPWVTLGAIAAKTKTLRLGTMLTPFSIRQPWKLASETATLDALSGGRLILSAGLGAVDTGFAEFGLPVDKKIRAERLDECLDILDGLWQTQPFAYSGKHFNIREQSFIRAPQPVQKKHGRFHVPIWMVGAWNRPRSMRRVLRCDGWLPNVLDKNGLHQPVTPPIVANMKNWLEEAGRQVDIIVEGSTPGDDIEAQINIVGPFRAAGANWWVEALWQAQDPSAVTRRIRLGPPHTG